MLAATLLALLPGLVPRQDDPAAALRAAVGLADPQARRAAAEALARRADVPIERWEELCASFGAFAPARPGPTSARVPLWTPDGVRECDLGVFVPYSYDPARPTPLLLHLHWTGGDGASGPEMWRQVAERLGMLVLAPSESGANVGYTYGERERAETLSALRWARLEYNVDENRVVVSGISRGGHLAWDLALRRPDLFAGLAPMIGGPRIQVDRAENNFRYLENVARLPIRDLQGARDDEVMVANLRFAFERLAAWRAPDAQYLEFPELGHAYDPGAVDWLAFLGSCRRDPRPEEVVRLFARPGEGRAFWLEVLAGTPEVEEVFVPRVAESAWERLDRFERQRFVQARVDERTARLEGRLSPTRVRLAATRVQRARVLYDRAMLPKKPEVLVQWRGRTVRAPVAPDARVLLVDFVERFDRTFLPVMEVVLAE